MRKLLLLTIFLLLFSAGGITAFALDADISEIYTEQLETSGAAELAEKLPEETREYLERLGIQPGSGDISLGDISGEIADMATKLSTDIIAVFGLIIGLIIIAALLCSVCESTKSITMQKSISACTNAAVCIIVALPIAQYISDSGKIIEKCCFFNEAFIPVFCGIMAASDQTATAASYSGFMLTALEGASLAVNHTVLPLLRAVLALSLVAALSPTLKLSSAIKIFEKYLKWILSFVAVMIVGITGIGTAASSAMDGLAARAAKYIVSSSVPVLGSAMGEALSTVKGCVNILRTSVGSFGIIAMAFILLPALVKGVLWQLCLNLCALASDLLGVKNIKELTDSINSTVAVMIAVIIFTGTLTVFTLTVMLGKVN